MSERRCRFVDGRCRDCGQLNTSPYADAQLQAICRLPACPWLGPDAAPVKVPCGCTAESRAAIAAGREPPLVEAAAAVCALHRRCLPQWAPASDELAAAWADQPESQLFRICATCPDREPAGPSPPA